MENASKALIIAGAILLAILLISLGIIIFSQAQDTINNSGMSQAELQTFNQQFVKYEGSQKGTVVKSMMQEVLAVNANGSGHTITVKDDNDATVTDTKDIEAGTTYDIELQYDKNGRVSVIKIGGLTVTAGGGTNIT